MIDNDDDGMIDESDLVDQIDFSRPDDPMEEDNTSCAPGRACANCVCGRSFFFLILTLFPYFQR